MDHHFEIAVHSIPTKSTTALGEGGAVCAGCHPVDDNAEANKQRRKAQNRKNQRAHRLRIREQNHGSVHASRPFQVRRWRLDEPDECDDTKCTTTVSTINRPLNTHTRPFMSRDESYAKAFLTPPSLNFPLTLDHLLLLVQYNVFRAFVSNKRTLNLLLTGSTNLPLDPSTTTCPISGPYRDDTNVFPLNPNIPNALAPTLVQQAHPHPIWINLIPFPRMRDNLIRSQGHFDPFELLQDLIGEFMGVNQFPTRQGTLSTITVSDPVPHDESTVTTGRKGLIVWGEPHEMQNWEATPGFWSKWAWAVEGCDDLLESSNRWRLIRGEDPMCPSSYLVEV